MNEVLRCCENVKDDLSAVVEKVLRSWAAQSRGQGVVLKRKQTHGCQTWGKNARTDAPLQALPVMETDTVLVETNKQGSRCT